MLELRTMVLLSWIALPTVMFGGYSLLRLLNRGDKLTPFQVGMFRAGHAHAGVLLVLSLVYDVFLSQTALPILVKQGAAALFFVGILAQSGGFFLHMARGQPGTASIGTTVTSAGAVILAVAVLVLVYGLIIAT